MLYSMHILFIIPPESIITVEIVTALKMSNNLIYIHPSHTKTQTQAQAQ